MTGFEPVNGGFADHCLRPLGYIAEVKWKLSAPSPAVKKYIMHYPKISYVPSEEFSLITGDRISSSIVIMVPDL